MAAPAESSAVFPTDVRRIVGVCMLLAGLTPTSIAGAILAYEIASDAAARHATGVVVDIESGQTFGADEYSTEWVPMYPVVEVTDEGRSFRFQNAEGCSPPRYAVGETVPVVYDPAQPEQAAIDAGYSWGITTLLCTLATPFLAVAALLLWPRRAKPS